jgi:hypothetical protein
MYKLQILFYFLIFACNAWAQNEIQSNVYSELKNYSAFYYGEPNEIGYKFLASRRESSSDTAIMPGLLVQINQHGKIHHIDSLRKYNYHFAKKIDSLYFLGAYRLNKYPDATLTYVLEICDLHGNVIQSYIHDFIENIPFVSGMAQVNDSIYIIGQSCQLLTEEPSSVFYRININSLAVDKQLAEKGAIYGNILKVDDQPTYLQWLLGLWIMDTTFSSNNKLYTDTTKASANGTLLPREDKPGWFGFGSCITPSNFYGICLIALNIDLSLDMVDLLYHQPDNNSYAGASVQSICKSDNNYFAAGLWNDTDPAHFFWNGTTPTNLVIVKYDVQLNRVWTKLIGGDRRYIPFDVHPRPNGGFMIAGGVKDNLNNNTISPFTMFFDADGELVSTEEVAPPGRYEFTIYGNPGREALRILARFEDRKMHLRVVDVMGRPMLSDFLTEGMNQFDTAYWPSGTYFMSIIDENGRAVCGQPWVRE